MTPNKVSIFNFHKFQSINFISLSKHYNQRMFLVNRFLSLFVLDSTELLESIDRNDIDQVTAFLENEDFDINLQSTYVDTSGRWYSGDAALHVAVRKYNNNNDIAKLIVAQTGINVNLQNDAGDTVLHLAVRDEGRIEIVERLLNKPDTNVNLQNQVGDTAFIRAIDWGNLGMVELLLTRPDINLNSQGEKGSTGLHLAMTKKNDSTAKLILARPGVKVNLQDDRGYAILHLAAQDATKIDIVKFLLTEHNTNINLQNRNGETALIKAVENGNDNIVKLLLKKQEIDLNLQCNDGQTVLHKSVSTYPYSLSTLELLLDRPDTNVNLQCDVGQTALHIVLERPSKKRRSEYIDELKLLLASAGVDVNLQDKFGNAPLHLAVDNDNLDYVKVLLRKKDIKVNLQNIQGNTASHLCLQNDGSHSKVIFSLLAKQGINQKLKNSRGKTVVDLQHVNKLNEEYKTELNNYLEKQVVKKDGVGKSQQSSNQSSTNMNDAWVDLPYGDRDRVVQSNANLKSTSNKAHPFSNNPNYRRSNK